MPLLEFFQKEYGGLSATRLAFLLWANEVVESVGDLRDGVVQGNSRASRSAQRHGRWL